MDHVATFRKLEVREELFGIIIIDLNIRTFKKLDRC